MADFETQEIVRADDIDPARAAALYVALGLDGAPPERGDTLPPFFHQIYFWQSEPAERLGRDGHPKVGKFIPDFGLPRRMWAGGRLTFEAPFRVGISAELRSRVVSTAHKDGRTGPLAFVTLRHEIWQEDRLTTVEEQDLVYREDYDPTVHAPAPVNAPEDSEPESCGFSSTLLFRYSALTFNGHRIHYDLDYAQKVEGYAGLVVHGPLLAQLLILKAEHVAPLKGFSFRGVKALTHGEAAVLNRDSNALWVRNGDGQLITKAEAIW